jgi:hypothetical protein
MKLSVGELGKMEEDDDQEVEDEIATDEDEEDAKFRR